MQRIVAQAFGDRQKEKSCISGRNKAQEYDYRVKHTTNRKGVVTTGPLWQVSGPARGFLRRKVQRTELE